MKTIFQQDSEAISSCIQALNAQSVIAAPTETVYGLMARWDSPEAREEIYRLKHRPANKRLQMLAPDLETAAQAGVIITPELQKIAERFWPGALTVITASTNGDTIGLRIPNHPFILRLLQQLDYPLAATSANLSGEKPAVTAQQATMHLDGEPAVCIDGGLVTVTEGAASTVVSILNGAVAILREGPISLEALQDAISGK